MAIAARGEFPAALAAVQDWLKPIERPNYVVKLLQESGLCSQYLADALDLLNAVIADQLCEPRALGECLDQIVRADTQLEQDARYKRLSEYFRRHVV